MQFLVALAALSFLIVVHEFGHFIVAKLSGIKVHEFALFMGPKIFSIKKGETAYSLRLIPLGGFVKMEGEEEASEDERAFNKKPVYIRAAVIAAGPVANIIAAFLMVVIITTASGYSTTIMGNISEGSPAYDAGIRKGDKITSFNGKGVYHPMDIGLFLYGSKGESFDVVYERGGKENKAAIDPEVIPENNYILGLNMRKDYGKDSNIIDGVEKGSPAEKARLRAGDIIHSLNGTVITDAEQYRSFMRKNKGKPFDMTVYRDNSEVVINNITPGRDKNPEYYSVGFTYVRESGGAVNIVKHSAIYSYSVARYVYNSLTWLISGRVSLKQLSGPVGIVSVIGDVVETGPNIGEILLNLLNISALISINLGLFNLIPFPALDGSKLILLLVEKIRRKPLPPEKEALISMIGLALLVMLMLFATYNDILRLRGG